MGKERASEGSEGRGSSRTCDAPGRSFAYSHQRRAHLSSARRRCLLHPPPTHPPPTSTFPPAPHKPRSQPKSEGAGGRRESGRRLPYLRSRATRDSPWFRQEFWRAILQGFLVLSFSLFLLLLLLFPCCDWVYKKNKKRQLHVSSQPGHGEVWGSGGREQRREGHSSMPYKRQPKAWIFFLISYTKRCRTYTRNTGPRPGAN